MNVKNTTIWNIEVNQTRIDWDKTINRIVFKKEKTDCQGDDRNSWTITKGYWEG